MKSHKKLDEAMQSSTPGRFDRSSLHLLHRAGQRAGEVFAREMGSDLTPRQYAVLASVAKSEGLSQTDLVAETGIDRSTLADVVRRMLKKGLIQRRRTKHDARAYAVRLTEEGRRILAESEPLVREIDQRILEVLPPAERLQFLDDLSAIINATDVALKEVSED
jgi:DNA-binding MarR family transcriptional regulator